MDQNMIGAVGFAMHEDRLARAERNILLSAVERGSQPSARRVLGREPRALAARMLVGLATRIAPTVGMPRVNAPTVVRWEGGR